jgi:hypothetical protein
MTEIGKFEFLVLGSGERAEESGSAYQRRGTRGGNQFTRRTNVKQESVSRSKPIWS